MFCTFSWNSLGGAVVRAFVAVHKDNKIRMASRSGGAFAALSRGFLENTHGSIYGAAIVQDFVVEHIKASNEKELRQLSGAKYVQSNLCKVLPMLKQDFLENRDVLFSGTPCQVAAVKELIPSDYSGKVLLVDIVCHSVPSPAIYKKFINQYPSVKEFVFRNKRDFGWRENISTITTQRRKTHTLAYCNLFYNTANMRPSCYNCPWKAERPGDITIGDCWGVEQVAPDMDDNFGTSVVLTNTDRGQKWWEQLCGVMRYKEVDPELVTKQHALNQPLGLPSNRAKFWYDYHNMPFHVFVKKYGKMSIKKQIRIVVSGFKTANKGVHNDQ